MILTETLFRKIISFAAPQEIQFHAELMDQASSVLKRAHKRGVELEYILEVRSSSFYILLSANPSLLHAWYEHGDFAQIFGLLLLWKFLMPTAVVTSPLFNFLFIFPKALPHCESARCGLTLDRVC